MISSASGLGGTMGATVFAQEADFKEYSYQLSEAEKQAARLLLYGAIVSGRAGEVLEIPQEIRDRYGSLARSYYGAIPTGAVGVGTYFAAANFLEKVEWASRAAKAIFGTSADVLRASGRTSIRGWEWFARLPVVRQGLESSARSSMRSFDSSAHIYRYTLGPVVKLVFNRGTGLFSLTLSGGSLLYGSSWGFLKSEGAAISDSMLSGVLGYDEHLEREIDFLIKDIEAVYPSMGLDSERLAVFKTALKDELSRQFAAKEYDDNAEFVVNVAALLHKTQFVPKGKTEGQSLITAEEHNAAVALQVIFDSATDAETPGDVNTLEKLNDSVAKIYAINQYLEAVIAKGDLDSAHEKEARQVVAQANRTVERIKVLFPK